MPTKTTAPPLDPIEALQHIKTLVRVAADSEDLEAVHKVLHEALKLIDRALASDSKK